MKTLSFAAASLVASALFFGCTTTRQNTAENAAPPRLQVTVSVPPTMSMLYEDEIAEAFGYRVSSILHEQGFRGRIRFVDRGEAPLPDVPVLAVNLIEWRVDHVGSVDCTFTAALQNGSNSQRLGVFSGTSLMTWPRHDWFARAEGFEDSARDAITDLTARLEKTGMIDRPFAGARR